MDCVMTSAAANWMIYSPVTTPELRGASLVILLRMALANGIF